MENKVRVKFIRPVYPYKSWDIGYIEEKKAKYFKNQVEIAEYIEEEKEAKPEKEVKPVKKRKQVKKKSNKAILKPKNTKWL